jgi:histidinol-phosphate aminotransferase
MFLKKKQYLREIARVRIPGTRDLRDGLRLDRNEKVDNWPINFIEKVLESKPQSFFSTYPNLSGLYDRIARHLDVEENQIIVSSGIDGVIKTLFEILVEPGEKIGVFAPTYAMYDVYAKLFQAELFHISYQPDYTPNWQLFDEFLSKKPVVLFLPNPNQPVESCFSLEELRSIAKKCFEAGCLLVVDEAYHYFGAESSMPLLKEFENVVVMRTFSKAFGIPSARLGYMVSTRENMELLGKTRFAHEANSVSAAMAEYLLDNFDIVKDYTAEINQSRIYVKQELEKLGIEARGNKGNYLLITLKSSQEIKECVEFLKARKIYVKGPWSAPWDNCLTITLGPRKIMDYFLEAIAEFVRRK